MAVLERYVTAYFFYKWDDLHDVFRFILFLIKRRLFFSNCALRYPWVPRNLQHWRIKTDLSNNLSTKQVMDSDMQWHIYTENTSRIHQTSDLQIRLTSHNLYTLQIPREVGSYILTCYIRWNVSSWILPQTLFYKPRQYIIMDMPVIYNADPNDLQIHVFYYLQIII